MTGQEGSKTVTWDEVYYYALDYDARAPGAKEYNKIVFTLCDHEVKWFQRKDVCSNVIGQVAVPHEELPEDENKKVYKTLIMGDAKLFVEISYKNFDPFKGD